ncbi:DUF2059 domain-containing protein [Hoeflea sp.]|uniref:DUF2059 domain-containing protein n=1 Tax=Hoeflea sp. TaxID=1940281 RepID=UPI003B026D9E
MSMATSIRRYGVAAVIAAAVSLGTSAQAQEPTEEHLAAARAAISAINATDQFDAILPNAAQNLKANLIQTAPNLQEVISVTVDETAIEMAGRRADLEREAALIYARNFTMQELNDIQAFYASESGKKLLELGPIATRQLLQAAEVWSNGISRDLAAATQEALRARVGETPTEGGSTDTQ